MPKRAREGARISFRIMAEDQLPVAKRFRDGDNRPDYTWHTGQIWSMGPVDGTRWVIPDEQDLVEQQGCRLVDLRDIVVIEEVSLVG